MAADRLLLAAPLALAFALATAAPAAADEVREQVEIALEYYEEGDLGGAITELEFAISAIRARQSALFAESLPEAPEGWEAGAAETEAGMAFMGGGGIVKRSYRQSDGSGRMEAQLVIDNPMVQGMAALMSNPAMMAAQPNTERVRIARENAMLKWEEDRGRGEISMMLGGRLLLQLEGQGLADKDILVDMMNAWDLAKLKDVAGL